GVCFFFSSRRRHTRFSRDWSSDVCSSDLTFDLALRYPVLDKENYAFTATIRSGDGQVAVEGLPAPVTGVHGEVTITRETIAAEEIGRASCRERVWSSGVGGGAARRGRKGR